MSDDDDYDITASKIRARMIDAQNSMRKQELADESKARLCDSIQKHKKTDNRIQASISNLEYVDAKLYDYIRRLEYVQAGIWCDKCAAAKQIHHSIDDDASLISAFNDNKQKLVIDSECTSPTVKEPEIMTKSVKVHKSVREKVQPMETNPAHSREYAALERRVAALELAIGRSTTPNPPPGRKSIAELLQPASVNNGITDPFSAKSSAPVPIVIPDQLKSSDMFGIDFSDHV